MKKFNLYSLALAGLMLGACSNELDVDKGAGGGVAPGEKGYISLSVNLPTQPSSRANDSFAEGDATEYNVNDATLLLFTGTNEGDAVFAGAYELDTDFPEGTPGGNITTSSKIVQEITKPTNENKVFALVVLNRDGLLSKSSEGNWSYGSGSSSTLLTTTTKFSDFAYTAQTLQMSDIADPTESGNFLMLNAPLYSEPGGTVDPTIAGTLTTLTEIDKNNIFSTATQAEENPAARIFVERAVAKVTVNGTPTWSGAETVTDVALSGWTLDITNLKTFPVRKVANDWWSYNVNNDYRFVGASAVATDRFRTYWGVDPNYDGKDNGISYLAADNSQNVDAAYQGFNVLSGTAPVGSNLTAIGSNAYCMENTFNVENMRKDQTTRVIVAAQLTVTGNDANKDFYVLNNAKGTIYKKDAVVNIIKNAYLQNNTIDGLLHGDKGLDLQSGETFGADDLVVEFTSDNTNANSDAVEADLNGGILSIYKVYVDPNSADKFKNGAIPEELNENNLITDQVAKDLTENYKISYYKNGVAYYPVMIRHFDETQTPWSEGTESYPGNEPTRSQNWLGRYGVLRNNWYEINVTGIRNIGSAEVEPEYGYDDPVESWISVEINILSWAKRTQDVEL